MAEAELISDSSHSADGAFSASKKYEFKERTLKPEYVAAQLKLYFNDCDRRSTYLLRKADRFRRYSWYSFFTAAGFMFASCPFFYYLHAKEYATSRLRRPLRVRNFFRLGMLCMSVSAVVTLFAASNAGYGFQAKAMYKFSGAYDSLAWEARRLQYQIDMNRFSAGSFLLSRKLEFDIEDDETKDQLEIKKRKDENTYFSELLLTTEGGIDEKIHQDAGSALRKEVRQETFERRLSEKLDGLSIAYYEFCDRKGVLDAWY